MGLTAFKGAIWVANWGDGTISRIDPHTNKVVGNPILAGNGPFVIAAGEGSLWVSNYVVNVIATVSRLDLRRSILPR